MFRSISLYEGDWYSSPQVIPMQQFNRQLVSHNYVDHEIVSNFAHLVWDLSLNFLRGMFWAYEWLLEANSSKRKGHNRCHCVSSWKFLANGNDPISIQKDGCSQEIFKVKNERAFSFVDILLYVVSPDYYENCQFSMDCFLTSTCIFILNISLRACTLISLHILITISWSEYLSVLCVKWSGPLHTWDWEPVTITLQALSLVEKAELVQVRFMLERPTEYVNARWM